MTPPSDRPAELADRVQSGEGFVRFEVSSWDIPRFAFGCGSGVALSLVLFAAVYALAFDPVDPGVALSTAAGMTACPGLALTAMTTVVGAIWAMQPRELVVTKHGFTFGGSNPPEVDVGTVRLSGAAGDRMLLAVGEHELLTCAPVPSGTKGWTYDGVGWLATRIAELTGQDLVDERPREAWVAWDSDPAVRARTKWNKELELNKKRYPHQHVMVPYEPTHEEDLNGLKVRISTAMFSEVVIEIDPTHLRCGSRSWPLVGIQDVRVMYEHRSSKKAGPQYSARLEVLVDDASVHVAKVPVHSEPRFGGEMEWVARRLRQAIETARPMTSRGTAEEVPEQLRDLRRSKTPE